MIMLKIGDIADTNHTTCTYLESNDTCRGVKYVSKTKKTNSVYFPGISLVRARVQRSWCTCK